MRNSLSWLAAVAGAVPLLAASSYVALPIGPVPITLQTLAVTLAGALLGAGAGATAVLLWLALGAAGLPVLANGTSGLAPFTGPTAGYLLAFPLAAALVGTLATRGWTHRFPLALAAMLIGNALCLLFGAAWLATRIGAGAAVASGVLPFLPGAVLKAVVGAVIVRIDAG